MESAEAVDREPVVVSFDDTSENKVERLSHFLEQPAKFLSSEQQFFSDVDIIFQKKGEQLHSLKTKVCLYLLRYLIFFKI
jgi:hypothetical protein